MYRNQLQLGQTQQIERPLESEHPGSANPASLAVIRCLGRRPPVSEHPDLAITASLAIPEWLDRIPFKSEPPVQLSRLALLPLSSLIEDPLNAP